MAVRLNTNQATTTATFTPTTDSILQFKSDNPQATVDIETRLNAAAPWIVVETMHATSKRLVRVAQLPSVQLTLRDGTGTSIVWDAE